MRFWTRETDLERALRAERPQPREQFVQMLSRQSEAQEYTAPKQSRRRVAPALVFVTAITAVFAVSLGSAGAVGAATHSVATLCKSVGHIVDPPKTYHGTNQGNGNGNGGNNNGNGGNGYGNGNGNGGDPGDPGHYFHFPFQHEYGHVVPVCFNGKFQLFIFSKEAFFLIKFYPTHFTAGFCARH